MRFQAYSTLAYAGRGLCCFIYFAPPVGGCRNAPVDQFGNETPTWHHLQNVNLRFQKLGPTLLQLTSNDVYYIGKIPSGCHDLSKNSLVSSEPGDIFLAGEFTHRDGSRYVMVVNKDFLKERSCRPQFRQPPKTLKHISPDPGALTPNEGEYVWLAPGAGSLAEAGVVRIIPDSIRRRCESEDAASTGWFTFERVIDRGNLVPKQSPPGRKDGSSLLTVIQADDNGQSILLVLSGGARSAERPWADVWKGIGWQAFEELAPAGEQLVHRVHDSWRGVHLQIT